MTQPQEDPPPAPEHMAPWQLPDPSAQLLLLDIRHRQGPVLRIGVLAGTALGYPESILQNHHGPATTFSAQKLPSANSHCCAEVLRLEHGLIQLSASQQSLEAGVPLLLLPILRRSLPARGVWPRRPSCRLGDAGQRWSIAADTSRDLQTSKTV